MKGLTDRQQEVLNFIERHFVEYSYSPSIREIAEFFKISPKGVHDHIVALRRKGFIMNHPKKPRTFVLARKQIPISSSIKVPIMGIIRAGKGFDPAECYDGELDVPASFLGDGDFFALQVRGDSMINAGIIEGDMAIIQKQSVAVNGEIVAARLEDMVTLKRFFLEKNRVRLQAENPNFRDIYTNTIAILGKLAKIIRDY